MSYDNRTADKLWSERVENIFAKKGSLPSEQELNNLLTIYLLSNPIDEYFVDLDSTIDNTSGMISSCSFWPTVSFTYDSSQNGVSASTRERSFGGPSIPNNLSLEADTPF